MVTVPCVLGAGAVPAESRPSGVNVTDCPNAPVAVSSTAVGSTAPIGIATTVAVIVDEAFNPAPRVPAGSAGPAADEHEPGQIVRVKEHPAKPMSVDDALYEMELVGHDFFLFHDKEADRPSVVYRRHAYDYGLIRLV